MPPWQQWSWKCEKKIEFNLPTQINCWSDSDKDWRFKRITSQCFFFFFLFITYRLFIGLLYNLSNLDMTVCPIHTLIILITLPSYCTLRVSSHQLVLKQNFLQTGSNYMLGFQTEQTTSCDSCNVCPEDYWLFNECSSTLMLAFEHCLFSCRLQKRPI